MGPVEALLGEGASIESDFHIAGVVETRLLESTHLIVRMVNRIDPHIFEFVILTDFVEGRHHEPE
ncbi:hypothetical protein YTPLAS18_10180 [Nitrospira sp.]|nr:hypothetical protein YTPLAS18_10180 [Nitrospira sp.]